MNASTPHGLGNPDSRVEDIPILSVKTIGNVKEGVWFPRRKCSRTEEFGDAVNAYMHMQDVLV